MQNGDRGKIVYGEKHNKSIKAGATLFVVIHHINRSLRNELFNGRRERRYSTRAGFSRLPLLLDARRQRAHLAVPIAGNERLGREHCMRQCSRVRPQQGPRMKYRQSGGKHGNRSFAQDAILTSLNSRRRTQFHQTSQTGFIFVLLVHSPGISECW